MKIKRKILFFVCLQFILFNYIYANVLTMPCEVVIGKIAKLEVNHTDITEVYGINNKITLEIKIKSKYGEPQVWINYRLNSRAIEKNKISNIEYQGNGIYIVKYDVPSTYLTEIGTLKYAFKVLANDELVFLPGTNNEEKFLILENFKSFEIKTKKSEIVNSNSIHNIIFESGHNDIENFRMTIPKNTFIVDQNVTVEQKKETDLEQITDKIKKEDRVVSLYEFSIDPGMKEFNHPLTIKVAYPDDNNDGKVDTLQGDYYAKNIRAFYYNEKKQTWEIVGGVLDVESKNIIFSISHFSTYALIHTIMNKDSFRPNIRIITPNNDSVNDILIFPNLDTDKPTIKLYDVNGRIIRKITDAPYQWDGKDSSGRIVESGVYIYQFKVEINDKNEFVSGTIAVAK